MIDRRRFHFDDDFVGRGKSWLFGILKIELLDSAVAMHSNSFQISSVSKYFANQAHLRCQTKVAVNLIKSHEGSEQFSLRLAGVMGIYFWRKGVPLRGHPGVIAANMNLGG